MRGAQSSMRACTLFTNPSGAIVQPLSVDQLFILKIYISEKDFA